MKLRWPTRYDRARALFFIAAALFAIADNPHNMTRDTAVICAVICIAAFLIAGLLKPLHDSTGEDA